ncbi:MAG: AraC family transcriptional regulator [Lentisphaeria bacterium]|nr:AraC family transcriptional regulator [Lentisphaeria bacterium]
MQNAKFCERSHYWYPEAFNNIDDVEFFSIPRCCGVENNSIRSQYFISGEGRGSQRRALFKFTIAGSGLLKIGEHRHILSANQGLLLVGPGNYSYQVNPEDDKWQFIFLSFRNEIAVTLIEKIIARNGNIFELEHNGVVMSEVWKIFEYFRSGNFSDKYQLAASGYTFLMKLDKMLDEKLPQANQSTLITQLTNYCFKHIDQAISSNDLAAVSGYTRGHLTRLFKLKLGITPSKFIADIKLNYALEIMQNEKISIKKLARQCGFADPGYFRRVFAKKFGVPPSEYDKI